MKKSFVLLSLLALTGAASASQTTLTQVWRVEVQSRDWFSTATDRVRSAAYNPAADLLSVVSRDEGVYGAGANTYVQINPATGADVSTRSLPVAPIGTFHVNKHGHDDAGVTYIGNLTTNTSNTQFIIYRLASANDSLTTAFEGKSDTLGVAPLAVRLGDTLAVTGSGTSTEIWAGIRNAAGPHLVKFTTTNGTTFTPAALLTIPGTWTESPTYRGLSVKGTGASAVIWCKDANMSAHRINPVTGAILDSITNSTLPSINSTIQIGYFEEYGQKFVGLGPGAYTTGDTNPQKPGYIVKVTDPAAKTVEGATVSLRSGTLFNGNGTGSVLYDPTRKNVIFLTTNGSLSAHYLSPDVTAAQDWSIFE